MVAVWRIRCDREGCSRALMFSHSTIVVAEKLARKMGWSASHERQRTDVRRHYCPSHRKRQVAL